MVTERDALRADIFKERENINKDELEVLDPQVTDIRFEYYQIKSGKTEGEGEGEWEEKWDAEKEGTLSHAVKVELTIEEEESREDSEEESYTRELIIPLMVHVDTVRGRRRMGGEEESNREGGPGRGKWEVEAVEGAAAVAEAVAVAEVVAVAVSSSSGRSEQEGS